VKKNKKQKGSRRALWRHYYQNTQGLIFVADCNDRDRMTEQNDFGGHSALGELSRILAEDELRDVPLLVFANKQDLPGACSVQTLIENLQLNKLSRSRPWHCQASSGITGEGLYEGLDWLSGTMDPKVAEQNRKRKQAFHALQLAAPCVAFVHHNRTSEIVNSVFHLLPQIMGFLGKEGYQDHLKFMENLQRFCTTQYFITLTGCKDVIPPLIKQAIPTSKSGVPALQPQLIGPLLQDEAFRNTIADEAQLRSQPNDQLFEAVLEVVLCCDMLLCCSIVVLFVLCCCVWWCVRFCVLVLCFIGDVTLYFCLSVNLHIFVLLCAYCVVGSYLIVSPRLMTFERVV